VRACKKCDKLICFECEIDGEDCTGNIVVTYQLLTVSPAVLIELTITHVMFFSYFNYFILHINKIVMHLRKLIIIPG